MKNVQQGSDKRTDLQCCFVGHYEVLNMKENHIEALRFSLKFIRP